MEHLPPKKQLLIALAALITVAVALTALTAAVLNSQQTIQANGNIVNAGGGNEGDVTSTVNVEVFSDAAATLKCSSISWGDLSVGDSATRVVYVKNTGNVAESLSLAASGWSPAGAGSVLSLTWDKEGFLVPAGGVVAATLTLLVGSDAGELGSFSLDIVVSGSA